MSLGAVKLGAVRGLARWRWVLVLGALLVLFLWHDNVRPWRLIQAENAQLQAAEIERQLEIESARLDGVLPPLVEAVELQRRRWHDRQQEVASLRRQQRSLEQKHYEAVARAARSLRDFERARSALGSPSGPGSETSETSETRQTLRRAMLDDRREVEALSVLIEDHRGKIETMRADLDAAEAALAAARQPLKQLAAQRGEIQGPGWLWWGPLTPFSPQIAVQEIYPQVDARVLSPGRSPRPVERCMTCHLGVDQPQRGSSWPAVLRAHPRLDLFVGESSPHPYGQLGCTVCHGGDGRATDFRRADHDATGDDPSSTMLPLPLLGAACQGCHGAALAGAAPTDTAPTDTASTGTAPASAASIPSVELNAEGQGLLFELGCRNCHATEAAGRPAPWLAGLAEKADQRWLYDRLLAPPSGHPGLAGAGQSEERQREDVQRLQTEALAVLSRLWDDDGASWPRAADGDAQRGESLFGSLGCAACHGSASAQEAGDVHGPPLGASVQQLKREWLVAWLLDPQAVQPGATMPSLRLSTGEAADLAAFLTSADPVVSTPDLPALDGEMRDRLLFEYLSRDLSLQATHAQIDGLTEAQRTVRLGEAVLKERGCLGCHVVPGLPATEPMGPLLGLGSNAVARLASSHVPQLGVALSAALGEPAGLSSPGEYPLSLAAGPRYELADGQALALLSALLQPSTLPAATAQRLPAAAVSRGEALIQRWGCRACHEIDGRGGGGLDVFGDQQVPPSLHGLGQRLQAQWLERYLQHPEQYVLRPWLQTRMPSYGMSAQQRLDLVDYFLALDGASAVHSSAPPSSRQDRVVGSMVFEILQCDRCHAGTDDTGGLEILRLSPSYRQAKTRLRPQWVVDWLLDPQSFRPSTSMPSYFEDGREQGLDYLSSTFESPLFSQQHQRLLSAFDTEASMEAYLLDRRRVATALRDYVWSLGEPSNVR